MDYILNGQATGDVATRLLANGGNINILKPWVGRDGRPYVAVFNGVDDKGQPKYKAQVVANAPATLRKDDWKLLDDAVMRVSKPRLRAVADLRSQGLVFNIPNGLSRIMLEYETMGDISPATISMDPVRRSEEDRPTFDLRGLPLPVIHKDFSYPLRQILVSRNGGSPLDTTTAELAARRVAEEAEKLLIGTSGSYSYGGSTIYGYINHPNRNTQVLTTPTGSNGNVTINEVLAMIEKAKADMHYGPYMLYASSNWDKWLDADYSATKGDNTLRDRIRQIEDITDIRTLDYLPTANYHLVLVQMAPETVREVIGMDITTVQWETHGGMELHFKVMAIMVPQLRPDADNNMGIVHGSI
jgi:uncharacterized linocin/CFP29 family protein